MSVVSLDQHGTLTLENDTDAVTLAVSQVNGPVHVDNNAAPPLEQITVWATRLPGRWTAAATTRPRPTTASSTP